MNKGNQEMRESRRIHTLSVVDSPHDSKQNPHKSETKFSLGDLNGTAASIHQVRL